MKFFKSGESISEEQSKKERRLVRRLDVFLMTFGCISQVLKYLDQTNINNAYVSGMKVDLHLTKNELNYFTTYFNIAYCIMLIPSQVLMTYIRPSIWLPVLELVWALMTGLIAMTTNSKQVYALRFFLGLCECGASPGMVTLLMHWYTPTEIAKRIGFYQSCQAIGAMMAGALQASIYTTLNGVGGLAGWRWLFVINAIITAVWGFAGFFMIPDYPNKPNKRAIWLKEEQVKASIDRLHRYKQKKSGKITWKDAKITYMSWPIWLFSALYISTSIGSGGYQTFILYLESLVKPNGKPVWSVSKLNAIPIGGGAINVAFVWIWAILADLTQNRWILIIVQAVIGLVPCIILSLWTRHPHTVGDTAAYAAYFISYMVLGTIPLIFSWLSDILPHAPESRSLIVGTAIALTYAISSWSQILTWPASEAPYYRVGWQSSAALWAAGILATLGIRRLSTRISQTPTHNDSIVVDGFNPGEVDEHRDEMEADAKSHDIEESGYEGEKLNEAYSLRQTKWSELPK